MKFSIESPPKIYANVGSNPGFTPRIKLYQVGSGNLTITSPDDEMVLVTGTPDWVWDSTSKWPGGLLSTPLEYVYVIVDDEDRILEDGNFSVGPGEDAFFETLIPKYNWPGAMERPLNVSDVKPYKFWLLIKDNLNRPIIPTAAPIISVTFTKATNSSFSFGDDPGNASSQRDTQVMSNDGGTGIYSYIFNVNGTTPMDFIQVKALFYYKGSLYEEKQTIEILGRNEFNTSRIANAGIIRP